MQGRKSYYRKYFFQRIYENFQRKINLKMDKFPLEFLWSFVHRQLNMQVIQEILLQNEPVISVYIGHIQITKPKDEHSCKSSQNVLGTVYW